ncbi:hypothetical protein G3480_06170 [Thiorhodococcus mannitoliphagus]|uniref:Uncharacterized protein n=1 Tax=Thiorhodococcus mannitoliphagus TaxID=329406 RepID=A0A6P1DW44_9GAMM|nr:hypothetical protein [Thiorhodococcus mannitoliphagus]NEX19904.1 hypothetical protein [Thiorhodococcus mannitoliphagus]
MKTDKTLTSSGVSKKPTPKTTLKPAYPAHVITMIYNPLAAQKMGDDPPHTDVLPFTVPVKLAMDRTFIQTINRIQAVRLAVYYPDNFYLHFTKKVLRMKRPVRSPEIMTLPRIARLLARANTKLLAWCWFYAVHWLFVTDTMVECRGSDFNDADGLMIKGDAGQIIPVSTGITFDERVEGLFLIEDEAIQLLFNPLHFSRDWLIGDLVDLVVHECAHCIVRGHNEPFIQIESRLRKELRRLVDAQRILEDAHDMLSVFK